MGYTVNGENIIDNDGVINAKLGEKAVTLLPDGITADLSNDDEIPIFDSQSGQLKRFTINELATSGLVGSASSSGGVSLNDIQEVTISSVSEGSILTYNGSEWVAADGAEKLSPQIFVNAPQGSLQSLTGDDRIIIQDNTSGEIQRVTVDEFAQATSQGVSVRITEASDYTPQYETASYFYEYAGRSSSNKAIFNPQSTVPVASLGEDNQWGPNMAAIKDELFLRGVVGRIDIPEQFFPVRIFVQEELGRHPTPATNINPLSSPIEIFNGFWSPVYSNVGSSPRRGEIGNNQLYFLFDRNWDKTDNPYIRSNSVDIFTSPNGNRIFVTFESSVFTSTIIPPQNGDAIVWNSTVNKWTASNLAGLTVSSLNSIPDVNASSPSDKQVLQYSSGSSQWESVNPSEIITTATPEVILISPNSSKWRLTVDDSGNLITTPF